jgi:pimeloyl-ACP methyl ester carboxylesterase
VATNSHTNAATVRRSYADTPDGQIHYRVAGAGDPIVMLHWAPGSGRQNEETASLLAARGYRVFAPDLIGYGDSDKPDRQWSIADHARNLGDLLDDLALGAVFIYGGHTSAAIAAEYAVNNPTRVRALVLDGSPVYDAGEREALAGSYAQPMEITADGDHMRWAWQRALRHEDMPLDEVLADCVDLLKAGRTYHMGYEAVFAYDMAERLPLLSMPVLAMTTLDDPLASAHEYVINAVPNCREFIGPLRASQTTKQRAATTAALFDDFFGELT